MHVTITIPPKVAAKLRKRASASGEPLDAYTSKLVEHAVQGPTLEELLAPIQDDFAKSGMTEAQLLRFGRGLLKTVRTENSDTRVVSFLS